MFDKEIEMEGVSFISLLVLFMINFIIMVGISLKEKQLFEELIS